MEKCRVIIAVDHSDHAHQALQFYLKHVYHPYHEVTLLHIADYPTLPDRCCTDERRIKALMHEKEVFLAERMKQEFSDVLKQHHVTGELKVVFGGRPGQVIVDIAREVGARTVVMGTRGRNRLKRTLLGSVSEHVLHHLDCPVIICRHC